MDQMELPADRQEAYQKIVSYCDSRINRYEARNVALLSVVGGLIATLNERKLLGRPFLDTLDLVEHQLKGKGPAEDEEVEFVLKMCRTAMGISAAKPARAALAVVDGGKE